MAEQILYLAGLVDDSIVDGPGMRLTIFTQGCPHHCEGCHNPQTWPMSGGQATPIAELLQRIEKNPLCSGVTISGGEPLAQIAACAAYAEGAKALGKSVWLYSGYTWEEILAMPDDDGALNRLLAATDVLVDGRFEMARRNLQLTFRGSDNQRLIDVAATRKAGTVTLWTNSYGSIV